MKAREGIDEGTRDRGVWVREGDVRKETRHVSRGCARWRVTLHTDAATSMLAAASFEHHRSDTEKLSITSIACFMKCIYVCLKWRKCRGES